MQQSSLGTQQDKIGADRKSARRDVHDVLVRDVAVGEHDLIHGLGAAQRFQLRLLHDGNAARIERTRKRRRINPAGDARDLRGGERHDFSCGIVAVDHVEVVKIAAGGAHDDDPTAPHRRSVWRLLHPVRCNRSGSERIH